MDRRKRTVIATLLAGGLLAGLGGCSGGGGHDASGADLRTLGARGRAAGYNVLLVTLDTVRADRLGCYGHDGARTPVIDALATNGVQFMQSIAAAPVTLPAHTTILTGLYPPSHGVRNNGTFRLDARHETLAEHLRAAGYTTSAIVGAYVLDARYGLDQGFEHYDDEVNPGAANRGAGHFNERPADRVSDAAIRWIDSRNDSDRPFFMWVHYFDPHSPYEPPANYAADFGDAPYDGEIAFVDEQLGRLLRHLEEGGLLERTLIVLTADHGEGLGQHSEPTHTRLIYDSTLRVPLILSSPSLFDERLEVRDRVAGQADIVPTVLDLLGLEAQGAMDGVNLLAGAPDEARALYVESMVPLLNHGWAPLHGLRRLHDKYIAAPRAEYYDLRHDPDEMRNLFDEDPLGARELRDRLETMMASQAGALEVAGQETPMDAEQIRRLAALGYVRAAPASGPVGQLDPKDMMPALVEVARAQALSESGRNAEALALIDQVLQRNPRDAHAWNVGSIVQKRLGRLDEAERYLRRDLELHPTSDGYVRLAQFLLARKSYDEFDGALDEAAKLDSQNGGIYIARGDRRALDGRFDEALEEFEKALEVDPHKSGSVARSKIEQARRFLERR